RAGRRAAAARPAAATAPRELEPAHRGRVRHAAHRPLHPAVDCAALPCRHLSVTDVRPHDTPPPEDPMTVLILTNTHDPTADDVIMRLRDRGTPVFRLDPADFPQRAVLHSEISADGWLGTLATEHRTLDLSTVTGVWYRRPRRFLLPEQMSRAERGWAADEARRGFGGIINTLPGWLNPPGGNRPRRVQAV